MSRRHRVLGTIGTVLLTAAIAIPLGAFASHQFTDVPDSNPFHTDIDALADSGVTTGCGTGIYCPTDYVTREQMAAFMNRLGALQAGKTPVVNATKLDGIDGAGFLQVGQVRLSTNGPWLVTSGSLVITSPVGRTRVAPASGGATGTVSLRLQQPGTFGAVGKAYQLSSVEICWAGTTTLTQIGQVRVVVASNFVLETAATDNNGVNAAGGGCRTVTLDTPASGHDLYEVALDLDIDSGGQLDLIVVAASWDPYDT